MKWLIVLFFVIFFINFASSSCEDNQIDINSASKEDLDKISGIGPVKADAIINARPFNSIDNLIDVNGIGNATLEKIKEQNLACVGSETKNSNENNEGNLPDKLDEQIIRNEIQEDNFESIGGNIVEKQEIREVIQLSSATKDIKDTNSGEDSNNYPYYGLAGFAVLLGFLFYMKKKRYKNEFE
ncbi:MAG: helix-hairpin-helix domain-containing protein [Nanoarchaeota archaeon]|nr:helix-hairpin-helix domain-containing protein [Nanoarchaeota archaeon]